PALRNFDVAHFEHDGTIGLANDGLALFPLDRVERINAGLGEATLDLHGRILTFLSIRWRRSARGGAKPEASRRLGCRRCTRVFYERRFAPTGCGSKPLKPHYIAVNLPSQGFF